LVLRVRAEATAAPLTTGLDAVPAFVPGRYRAAVTAAASRERLRPALLAAVLEVESGFRPRATSSAGAVGLAQFLPATWAGTWNPWRAHDPREPGPAIAAAARYLGRLLAALDGDEARALAAYNAGVAAARRPASTWPAETRAYVPKVLALAASGGRRGAHLVR
jgi:soluble lytic murein transglycosylase-like protein